MEATTMAISGLAHGERLMKNATFIRDLVALAKKYNGDNAHWEAERIADAEAMEAGAMALLEVEPLRASVSFLSGAVAGLEERIRREVP